MKVNQKYIEIGLVVLILIVGICAYNFGYKPYSDKADALETEINSLKERQNTLQGKLDKANDYVTTISNADDIISIVLEKYGAGITSEKIMKMMVELQDSTGLSINSFSLTNPSEVFKSVINPDEPSDQDVHISKSTANISFSTGYTEYKKVVDYINNYPERTNIESFSLSYNQDNGTLNGSAVYNLYAVEDKNHTYEAPVIENIEIGNNNLFRAVGVEEETEEGTEEGEEETLSE